MKRMILPSSAVAVLIFALAACTDSTKPPAGSPTITGTVTDVDGAPVVNAAVVLDLDMAQVTATTADKPQTTIIYTRPDSTAFEFLITDACDGEVFYDLNVPEGQAGNATITWTGKDLDGLLLPEGVYRYHMLMPDHEPQTGELMLARNLFAETGEFATIRCDTVRQTWRVAASTDADGRFTIAKDCWDFGRSTPFTDETGEVNGRIEITSRVRLWFYPEGRSYGFSSEWGTFDAENGASFTVVMPAGKASAP